jgi:hypothetical protein
VIIKWESKGAKRMQKEAAHMNFASEMTEVARSHLINRRAELRVAPRGPNTLGIQGLVELVELVPPKKRFMG